MFLIALSEEAAGTAVDGRRSEALEVGSAVFEEASHRRIWIDFKRGAAVMWRPSYHAQWKARVEARQGLESLGSTLRFAQANHIDYVICDCRAFDGAHATAVFHTADLCVGESR